METKRYGRISERWNHGVKPSDSFFTYAKERKTITQLECQYETKQMSPNNKTPKKN